MLPIFFMKKFNHKLWYIPVGYTVLMCTVIPILFSDTVTSVASHIFNYVGNTVSNFSMLVAILSTCATSIYIIWLLGNCIWSITFETMSDYELRGKMRNCSKTTAEHGGTEVFITIMRVLLWVTFALFGLTILVWFDVWISVRILLCIVAFVMLGVYGFYKSLQQVKALEDEDFINNLSR